MIEAGLLLVIAPWTASWQHNYFAVRLVWLGTWMDNQFVRGAISGVGLVTTVAGLRDFSGAIIARHARAPQPPEATGGMP